MDVIDKASETEGFLLAKGIESSRKSAIRLKPTGFCRYCHEAIEKDMIFCDEECAEDYDWFNHLKKQKIP